TIVQNGKVGVLVEVNCETDFVAKNDAFKAFTDAVAAQFAENDAADVEAARVNAVQALGENIRVRRHARLEVHGSGAVASYIHTGGKVGVLLEVGAANDATVQTEEFKQLVRDITLQIAAANPVCVARDSVPAALAEREREVYRGQVPPGKPANIVEQIVDGKMNKFYSTSCLLEQAFIKNPDQTVAQIIAERNKALGESIVVRNFLRFTVGEELPTA
ncbi:MAG: translation elongation factor Ts, partial [Verrucomicrobia bacterium]|nr:translation elongation factor Ts [Verrucomicrobiota bacterium]